MLLICLNADPAGAGNHASGLPWKVAPVMHNLKLEHAAPGRIDQAYPLVLLVRPDLSLEAWRNHCGRRTPLNGSGLLLALDPGECVRGLCSYRIGHRPTGAVMEADIFVVAHPFAPRPIVTCLLDELERLAVAAGCRAIEFAPPDFDRTLRDMGTAHSVELRPGDQLGG
jgi:hypothetical protein